jgi:Ran-binding protein 1
MRAKIYRWRDAEWKERGTGQLKILRHRENNKIRFIMRQEKTLKVVANFFISDTPMYCELTPLVTNDRAYTFLCTDHSDTSAGQQERFTIKLLTVDGKSKFSKL